MLLPVLFLVLDLELTFADLPVHCVQPDVIGLWRFHVGSYGVGTGDPQCGFTAPDPQDGHHELTPPIRDPVKKEQGKYWLSDKFKEEYTLEVLLKDWTSEVISVSDDGKKYFESELPRGEWTMVYDEGFHVAANTETGLTHSFFAFSKYMLGEDSYAGSTNNFANGKNSFCDTSLLGWYKRVDQVKNRVVHQQCFWGERIAALHEVPKRLLKRSEIAPPMLPVPAGASPAVVRALGGKSQKGFGQIPPSNDLSPPDSGKGGGHASRPDDFLSDTALRDNVFGGVRNPLNVVICISGVVSLLGLWMNMRVRDKDTPYCASIPWILMLLGICAIIMCSMLLKAQSSLGASSTSGTSIKNMVHRIHEHVQAAKQANVPVRWQSDPEKVKVWLRERREKHGIQISENSQVEQLLDLMSPPLAAGLPGFSTEQIIGPVRALAIQEQMQIAQNLSKAPAELTTADMQAYWKSSGKSQHEQRTFTLGGDQLDANGWGTLLDFDWRNVSLQLGGGKAVESFVSKVPDQGGCGSCYAIAATSMITSRLMLRYPELHAKFAAEEGGDRISVHQQMNCNPYNQGCGGGYPYLVAKWSFENELYTDSCVSMEDKCSFDSSKPACSDRFRVQTWRYVGGALGRCGMHHLCEAAIREELYKGGPLVTSIEPTSAFTYKGGVSHAIPGMHDKSLPHEIHTTKDDADCMDAECFIWRKVDHSVLLVGWGEDMSHGPSCQPRIHKSAETERLPDFGCETLNERQCATHKACTWRGFPFWTIQNSYGPSWGANGYLSFGPRGQDPMRVESMVLAADVEWLRDDGAVSAEAGETHRKGRREDKRGEASLQPGF